MIPLSDRIKKEFLSFVLKPGRYVGNELNVIKKEHSDKVKVALIYPDTYEIGMSYMGLSILYHLVNKRPNSVAERAFTPWIDAEKILRDKKIPLFSLESHAPLKEFDILGFSLSYELTYTNVLNILDLSGIPIFSKDRGEDDPLIIAGGCCTSNPEPMSDFIDIFVLGDGEEVVNEILDLVEKEKRINSKKSDLIKRLSKIEGLYVPSFYNVKYNSENGFEKLIPESEGIPEKIKARSITQLKNEFYPISPLVSFVDVPHDRLSVEIMRGCPQACRFCQARLLYRPKREREVTDVIKQVQVGIANSGWDEVSLISLSSTDYRNLKELVTILQKLLHPQRVSISLPSLRPGSLSEEIARALTQTRKPGLTFAPEAGTQRLRDVIKKNINEDDLLSTSRLAYSLGWNLIKLYFMIGLPTEKKVDLDGIADLIKKVLKTGREIGHGKNLNVTLAQFVPKAHTSFQWEKLEEVEEIQEKIDYLKYKFNQRNLNLKFRDPQISYLEGILCRGDRRMGKIIYSAWKKGAKLDAWVEHFNYQIWEKALKENNFDDYSFTRELDSPLPWDHINYGVKKEILIKEREISLSAKTENVKIHKDELIKTKLKIEKKVEEPTGFSKTNEKITYGRKKKKRELVTPSRITKSRIRVKWKKEENVRFTSHLDVVRTFERAVRRANLPISYSLGFHPHQKVAFGPPLPLGFISDSEFLDMQLEQPFSPALLNELNKTLPIGFEILEIKNILSKTQSLSSIINCASYAVNLPFPIDEIELKIKSILEMDSLKVTRITKREEKEINVRYNIFKLQPEKTDTGTNLKMLLRLEATDYARPDEILRFGFEIDKEKVLSLLIKREDLLIRNGEKLLSPMDIV
jgi:radical SAM family uncharacterized protein/radical SAM-linked protein